MLVQNNEQDNEMKYGHMGIPINEKRAGERYMSELKCGYLGMMIMNLKFNGIGMKMVSSLALDIAN